MQKCAPRLGCFKIYKEFKKDNKPNLLFEIFTKYLKRKKNSGKFLRNEVEYVFIQKVNYETKSIASQIDVRVFAASPLKRQVLTKEEFLKCNSIENGINSSHVCQSEISFYFSTLICAEFSRVIVISCTKY